MRLEAATAAVIIQKRIRGCLGRKRFKRIKKAKANAAYEENFSDAPHTFEFRFKANGAAYLVQHWFRNLKYRRIKRWHKVHAKYVETLKQEKILRRGIRKSGKFTYSRTDLNDKRTRMIASATVLCRVARGFLGRRRFKRLKREHDEKKRAERENAIRIQTAFRRTSVRVKYPLLGQRHRMLQAKRLKWEQRNSALRKYVESNVDKASRDCAIDDIQSETDNTASSVTGPDGVDIQPRRLFVSEHFLKRRQSFLFQHLRLGTMEYMQTLHAPATVIQCIWRAHSARQRLLRKRKTKNFRRLAVLSAWLARIHHRWRRDKAARVIQPVWRSQVERRRHQLKCLIKIQSAWRSHITRKNFRILLKLRYYSTLKLVYWARRIAARREVRAQLRRLRQLNELRDAGLSCFTATRTRWVAHYMWLGVKIKNYTSQHEMQKLFQSNSVNGGMETAKMLKIAKECNGLISDTLTANQVEIQFTKIKNPLEKRIDYGKFIDLCMNLAVLKFMGVDPSRLAGAAEEGAAPAGNTATAAEAGGGRPGTSTGAAAAATKSTATSATVATPGAKAGTTATAGSATAMTGANATAASAISTDATAADPGATGPISISSFYYAGQRGRPALITRFIAEMLCTVVDFKRAVEYLDSKNTSAGALARILMRDNVITIQRFVRNRTAVRRITADLVKHKAAKVAHRRNEGARKIQGCIRGFLGRRMIKRMAQHMYTKFIDGDTEREYWTNPRTNASYWTKPRLLGEFDCGVATRMPKEEERYVVQCSSCESISATCYCIQCTEAYCTMCYAMGHRTGQRKQHVHLLIDNCVQCEFQAGTRYCQSCQDMYCDSCYKFMHRRGRLRFHVMKRNCEACEVCADLSAQWVETLALTPGNNHQRSKHWCNRCYRNEHGVLPRDVPATSPPTLTRLEFYGKNVQLFREKAAKEKRIADIAASFESRKKELHRQKVEKAARFVQRVYRGYRKRCAIAPFLEERRMFMRMRREEAEQREAILYRLTALLGVAKSLQSDTPLERVMKLYPAYMHHILAISVDNNWTYACRLLTEHEEHLKACPPSNLFQRMGARMSVAWHRSRDNAATKQFDAAAAQYTTSSEYLSTAQASGALAPRKLEELKASTAKAEERYKAAQKKKWDAEANLMEAQEKLTNCVGPRGIQTLVETRRREGLMLPFRVTIKRHSRLALVTYWDEDMDRTEEELAALPPRAPGKWKSYLNAKDFVRIQDVSFRIVAPPPKIVKKAIKGRPTSASMDADLSGGPGDLSGGSSDNSGEGGASRKDKKAAAAAADNSGSGTKKKKRRKMGQAARAAEDSSGGASKKKKQGTGSQSDRPGSAGDYSRGSDGSDHSDGATPNDASGAVAKGTDFGLEVEVREEPTEDHIILDHPWLLPDVYNIEVYKVLPRIFYYQPLFYLKRQFIASYPVQKTAAIAAITLHKYASFLTWLQSSFDEESDSFAAMQAKIESSQQSRDKWLTISHTIVQMSFDFTLRRQVFSLLAKVYGISAKLLKFLRSFVKSAGGEESPYEYWKRSLDKTDVVCILDKGNDRTEVIGEFKLDLGAPAEIMREFIRRAFRTQLNATIGESFLFFKVDPDTAEEEILLRENEYKTYSKTFCFERTDAKTMNTAMTILIIPDPKRGRVLIPEFAAETPEEAESQEMQSLLVSTK